MRLAWCGLLAAIPGSLHAQPSVRWSGEAFIDYQVIVASPVDGEAGANGFDYRRLYLGAEAPLSSTFSLFARLEAQSQSTTASGRPVPFVKDLFVTWDDALGPGHQLRLGVQAPPLFQLSEETWGYRSLAPTVMDRVGANSSRDFGLRADGPLASGGALRYGVMAGNGSGIGSEERLGRGKHVYGQIRFASDRPLRASLGLDYTSHEAGDPLRRTLKASAFVGAVTERAQGGFEGFVVQVHPSDPLMESTVGVGVSAFGALNTGARTSLVARVDGVGASASRDAGLAEVYALGAFVYRPTPQVEVMPNAYVSVFDGLDAHLAGRVTVHAEF